MKIDNGIVLEYYRLDQEELSAEMLYLDCLIIASSEVIPNSVGVSFNLWSANGRYLKTLNI